MTKHKRPVSVLVVLHDGRGNTLILERADRPGFWQSVTGSLEDGETPTQAAYREVEEETGLRLPKQALYDCGLSTEYDIYPQWRHRYPPGTYRNTEHTYRARIDPSQRIRLSEREHTSYRWLPLTAAAALVFSPSNQAALLRLCTEIDKAAPLLHHSPFTIS